ncbi:hypothetical protein R1sor_006381 [Riccia sorocarpa]|uniref:Plastid lipid-associated protein/fibrillin conserved domain-containing protein n=1 Tax=Riccia sorocarpa TaxID=122646 RepID=A0ABD3HMB6_9MARC
MALVSQTTTYFCPKTPAGNSARSSQPRTHFPCSNSSIYPSFLQPAPLGLKHSVSAFRVGKNKRLCSLQYGSTTGSRLPLVRSQFVQFQSSRAVSIPFKEDISSAKDYLKELERVVRVTFPDSARITYVGDSVWRARLRPVTFINFTATPLCDIRVYNEDSALCIYSDKLYLDFTGVPDQFKNVSLNFQLSGSLRALPQGVQAGRVKFEGSVLLKLGADMPFPISLLPETLLTGAGNGILDTILGAMESALLRGIVDDYYTWCKLRQGSEFVRASKV